MKNFFDLARPMGRLQYFGIIFAGILGDKLLTSLDSEALGKFILAEFGGQPGIVLAVALMKLAVLAIAAAALAATLRRATDLALSTPWKAFMVGLAIFGGAMQETLTSMKFDSFFDDGGPRFLLALLVAAALLIFVCLSFGFGAMLLAAPGKLWREGAEPAPALLSPQI